MNDFLITVLPIILIIVSVILGIFIVGFIVLMIGTLIRNRIYECKRGRWNE